jgi:hypothetical protein
MSLSSSPPTSAPRRVTTLLANLGRGWMLVCAAYVLAATALDASFYAHYEEKYDYKTPLHRADFVEILRHFRIADVRLNWYLFVTVLPMATALLLLVRPIRRHPLLYLCMALPFTLVWGLVPAVVIQCLLNGLSVPAGCTDGECLHEAWPLVESYALWGSVTMYIVVVAIVEIVRRIRERIAARRGAVVPVQA